MTYAPVFDWPDGKSSAAIVTVLFDDGMDAIARAPDLLNRSKSLSVWQYGASRGVDRLLQAFDAVQVKTTWIMPSAVAQKHPGAVREISDTGHELAGRGVDFEDFSSLTPAQAEDALVRSADLIEQVAGQRPVGFRLPRGHWPRHFDRCLRDAGYRWSSSLNGDDVPYLHPSSLIEIPVQVELEDRPYFQFNFAPAFPRGLGRMASYEGVLHNWIAEFDAYRRYGLCYVLQVRPEMLGTPGRIFILNELLQYICSHGDVWLAQANEVAHWSSEKLTPPDEKHPLMVFESYRKENGFDD